MELTNSLAKLVDPIIIPEDPLKYPSWKSSFQTASSKDRFRRPRGFIISGDIWEDWSRILLRITFSFQMKMHMRTPKGFSTKDMVTNLSLFMHFVTN